tara:strand:+ start:232 stop:1005 length:774 start_codon:yes stop_codon:yes gene_type:complete
LKVGKQYFKLPVIAGIGRSHKDTNEPHLTLVLEKLYTSKIILVDIGVNIGQTLLKWKSIGGLNAVYLGFEPNPSCIFYLAKLVTLNKFKNVSILPFALGSKTSVGQLKMTSYDLGPSVDPAASLSSELRDDSFYSTYINVPIISAHIAFETLNLENKEYILKIDVEGFEEEVLKGMASLIARDKPIIILEILSTVKDFSTKVNKYRQERKSIINQFFLDIGYQMYNILSDGNIYGDASPTSDFICFEESFNKESLFP